MSLEQIKKLTHSCSCNACSHGCLYGSGALGDEDIVPMARLLGISEEELTTKFLESVEKYGTTRFRPKILRKNGKPYGTCIFFDKKKGCRVHEAKPLECSIAMGCKPYGPELIAWFHAHYFVDPEQEDSLTAWSLATKQGTIPGANSDELKKITR